MNRLFIADLTIKGFMKLSFAAFLFFVLAIKQPTLFAQQPACLNYTVKDGLPSNSVYCIFQDAKGYIWLGTDRGVVRYDGYHFTNFTTTDGLADNMIFDIYEDSQHRIWFACNNGNACYYFNNEFYQKKNNSLLAKINNQGPGLKTLEDKEHNIILLTHFNIYKIRPDNQITELFKNQSKLFSSICLNSNKEVLVLESGGIHNLNTGENIVFNEVSANAPQLHSKALISNGKMYHTQKSEIACNKLSPQAPGTEIFNITSQTFLTQCILDDRENQLLVGTQNGMYSLDKLSGKIRSHAFDKVSISAMLRDREGNLWVSSLNKGIYLSINPRIRLLNNLSGLGFDYCSFIDKLADGSFAFGSNQFQMAFLKNHVLHNLKLPEQFGEGKVEKIRMDAKGDYYVTLGSVMMKVSASDFSVRVYNIASRDILFENNNKILVVAGNSLREINNGNALSYYNNQTANSGAGNEINIPNIKANGLYKGKYTGKLYLYGLFGVKTYLNGRAEDLIQNNEYLSKNIYRVQETPDGLLWLASNIYGVLVICNNKVIVIDNTKGLPSNFINALYADVQSNIWVAGAAGLSKITYSLLDQKFDYRIENYSKADGLISQNINDVIRDSNDIYIATDDGICIFTEADLHLTAAPPVLNLEAVYFNNKRQISSTEYFNNYKSNSVKIKFAGLSFRSLGNIQYKYRMKGLEDHWSYTKNTVLEYPALSPGNYEFELIAISAKGVSSEAQYLRIQIQPPFWRAWWFVLIISLLAVCILIYLLQKRFAVIKGRHLLKEQLLNLENENLEAQKQQAVYEHELSEIKHQALRLHMNPHFIFNAINSIQGFYASGETEKAKTYIGKFSSLLRMILDQSRKESISIQDEMKTITYYLDLNTLRFENKFLYELIVDEALQINHEEIPPMLIQPFIENAIIHGIAPLKTLGKISVRISDSGKYICCEIEDNGVGREFSFDLNKDRVYTSTGIQVTQKRLELYNGQSTEGNAALFKIIDLRDEKGQAAGTKVIFYVLKNEL